MIDFRGLHEILSPTTFNKVKEEVTEWVISQITFDVPTERGARGKKDARSRNLAPVTARKTSGAKRAPQSNGGGRGKPQAVKQVGGKQFSTIADAVDATGIPYLTIRKSAQSGEPIKRGPHKGKRFVYA